MIYRNLEGTPSLFAFYASSFFEAKIWPDHIGVQDGFHSTLTSLWATIFGLITEVIQQFIPGRNREFYDGLADTLGIVSGFYLYQICFRTDENKLENEKQ